MSQIIIFYDDWCPNCSRFARLVKRLDWCGLVSTQKMRGLEKNAFVLKPSKTELDDNSKHQDKFLQNLAIEDFDLKKAQEQMACIEIKNCKSSKTTEKNQSNNANSSQVFYGFISIYKILLRLPLYWILFFYTFPLLYLAKVSGVGDFIYKQVAVKRKMIPLHCDDSCETKSR